MDRRKFLHHGGVAATLAAPSLLATSAHGAGAELSGPGDATFQSGPRAQSILVAAADAPTSLRSAADYRCDGNNDQAQINAAVAFLGARGGLIQLTEGTFNCTGAVRLGRRIALFGKGRATILKAHGTWLAHDGSEGGGVIEPLDDGIDKITVAHLAIDGNRYNNADVRGIYANIETKANFDEFSDAAHTYADLYIHRTRRHGIHLAGSHSRANKLSRIRIINVGDDGAGRTGEGYQANGYHLQCNDSSISQCETGSASGNGFYLEGANNRLTNCKAWFSELTGFQVRNWRLQLTACEAQDNREHGFYITSGPTTLVSCHADSNSWNASAPESAYDGFHIPWGSRIQLIGCSAYDKNESSRGFWQRYGFYLGSSADQCQIIATVRDNASGATGGSGATNGANLLMVNG